MCALAKVRTQGTGQLFTLTLTTIRCGRGHAELAYRILSTLPRSRLAGIQRRIAPLLQFDLVGVRTLSLPA